MPAGRPSKPTALKVLHGDRKDRINDAEPVPSTTEVTPPFRMSKAGREVWDRLAPDMVAKGVLTSWDVDQFAELCEALVILRAKRRESKREPVPGAPSPMSEYRGAVSVVRSLGAQFGLTPADRAKLTVEGREDDGKGAERLLS